MSYSFFQKIYTFLIFLLFLSLFLVFFRFSCSFSSFSFFVSCCIEFVENTIISQPGSSVLQKYHCPQNQDNPNNSHIYLLFRFTHTSLVITYLQSIYFQLFFVQIALLSVCHFLKNDFLIITLSVRITELIARFYLFSMFHCYLNLRLK